jgi:DNA polymerase III subunit alpha
MIESLRAWLECNFISHEIIDEEILDIEEFGKLFIFIADGKTIIKEEYCLNIHPDTVQELNKMDLRGVCFFFGERWYWTDFNLKKDSLNELVIKPNFFDLKNIGKSSLEDSGNFIHLGIHDEYELMNGSGGSKDWIQKAKFLNMSRLGFCNENTLAGALAFQIACGKEGIKPVIGETITVARNYLESEEIHNLFKLKVYVKNKIGWRNLLRINKSINVDFNRFIPESELMKFSEGLYLIFDKESYLCENIDDEYKVLDEIFKYKEESEFEDLFIQIDSVEFENDDLDLKNLNIIKQVFRNYSNYLEPILINDSYYVDKEFWEVKKYLNNTARVVRPSSKNQFFKSEMETLNCFSNWLNVIGFQDFLSRAVKNTKLLSDNCDYEIEIGKHKLPKFKTENNEDLFFELLHKGIESKLQKTEDLSKYLSRLEKECEVIIKAGLIDYFLILWDIIKAAKDNDILVGVARGSAGGSLVCYLLDIIDIDPIEFDLLFERFLNETRVSGERAKSADSLPDVDVDFEANNKDWVKRYIESKYGYDRVCSIGTFTRMKLKTCIKDFSKQFGLEFSYVNFVTKSIPDSVHDNDWQDIFEYASSNKILMDFIQKNPKIVNLTKIVLNSCKSKSIHPSALIIVPDEDEDGNKVNIFDWVPIKKIDGFLVSEWEGKYMERAGFLKEDILALSQLDKFKNMIKLVKRNYGKDIVLRDIPLNDRRVFKYFQKGWNEDVFQFGTAGLKTYSQKVIPTDIEHLVAMNALYRPGPMESNAHNDFASIKSGKKKPEYDYGLREVTEATSGLYVYQEQIMRAVHVLGNLSLVEADEVRTVMKKFDAKKMKSFEDKFLEGAISNGCSEKEAVKIWKKLMAFAGYGFNKSHAAAYSIIGYQSQWFKVNYPLEFWTTALQFADEKIIPSILNEFGKVENDISLSPVDINESQLHFECNPKTKTIFWSLEKVKNVGEKAVEEIISKRNKGGNFLDLEDFLKRVNKAKVNKKVVTHLILSGAFDNMFGIEEPKERINIITSHCHIQKSDLPEFCSTKNLDKNYVWTLEQKRLSGFGMIDYKSLIKSKINVLESKNYLKGYKDSDEFHGANNFDKCTVGGIVCFISEKNGKYGKYGLVTIENNNTIIQLVFDEESIDKYIKYFEDYSLLKGKLISIDGVAKYDKWREQNVLKIDKKSKLLLLS